MKKVKRQVANEHTIKACWETPDDKDRLRRVIEAIQGGREDWGNILNDFPEVKDVKNGKDLRGANLYDKDLRFSSNKVGRK